MLRHLGYCSFDNLSLGESNAFFFGFLGIVLALLIVSERLFNGFPSLGDNISSSCDKRITATTDFSRNGFIDIWFACRTKQTICDEVEDFLFSVGNRADVCIGKLDCRDNAVMVANLLVVDYSLCVGR